MSGDATVKSHHRGEMAQAIAERPYTEVSGVTEFAPARWAIGLGVVCLAPGILWLMGVDFSTRVVPLDPGSAGGMSSAELSEAAHAALRGGYTHTLLEWSAFCAALFACVMTFVHFRLTDEISLPIIGVALVCAGGMDAFHTFAADRLTFSVEDSGAGFDYRAREAGQGLAGDEAKSGRGITLLRSLCEEVSYHDRGNRVEAVYAWSRNDSIEKAGE